VNAPILQVQNLSHHYPDGTATLDALSFDLHEAEVVSLIGPSGCGKSTLLRVLLGLEQPTTGQVTLRPGTPEHPFAYYAQDDNLFEWRTVVDNAALGLDVARRNRAASRALVRAMLLEFGLDGFGDHFPSQLSGGMRQRTALLRTVAQHRPILLLDEPFSALDALTRSDLNTWLRDAATRHGWTILLVTHDQAEARFLSHRIIELSARPASVVGVSTAKDRMAVAVSSRDGITPVPADLQSSALGPSARRGVWTTLKRLDDFTARRKCSVLNVADSEIVVD